MRFDRWKGYTVREICVIGHDLGDLARATQDAETDDAADSNGDYESAG
jgi:hypothetical protein